MSSLEVEIVPLTDDQIAAIKECRFVGTNLDRTMAFGYTKDKEVAHRCPGGVTPYTRSRNPVVTEYEIRMAHPDARALVAELQHERKAS